MAKKPWIAPMPGRAIFGNPLSATYKTADDRYLALVMLQPTRYWAEVCHLVGRSDLADDPRFGTTESIEENIDVAVDALTEAIAARPLSHWTAEFAKLSGPWAPVQDSVQVTADAQVRSNDYIVSVQSADGTEFELVTNPVQFDTQPPRLRRGPAFAEHTDAVLRDLGYDRDRVIRLKVEGVVT
jgi:crotonobetainyl-CoA:carnitine CoA-transferase CaiB-like acyl-CoA transferase